MSTSVDMAGRILRRWGWDVLAAGLAASVGAAPQGVPPSPQGGGPTGTQPAAAAGLVIAAPGLAASDDHYAVTVISTREVPQAAYPHNLRNEVSLLATDRVCKNPPRKILFGGPQEDVRDTLSALKAAAGQLIAATGCSFAVFDLRTGTKRAHVYSSCHVAVSPDGRRVAYVELQPHFMPPQAKGSVVRVLDVVPLATSTVFPNASEVSRDPNLLSTWEDDLSKVHDAGPLHWSPDGRRLLFFCLHGLVGHWGGPLDLRSYLVTVELADLKHPRFAHQPIARDRYLRPGAEPPRNSFPLFDEAIEWLPGGAAVCVIPRPDASWMKRDIVFELPVPK